MAREILVPIDGSSRSYEAFEYAVREFPDATLTAPTVSNPADVTAGGTETGMATDTEEWTEIENETWSNDSRGSARSPRNTAWPRDRDRHQTR